MKWFGKIGFSDTIEKSPGVHVPEIVEKDYYGDLIKNVKRTNDGDKVNDDISLSNQLSIISDPYNQNHFHSIKYVEMFGAKWKVSSVEVQFPRLLLSLGGMYNG